MRFPHTDLFRIATCVLVASVASALFGGELEPVREKAPLGESGIGVGVFSDRTLVVGLEVDRSEARVLGYTLKPRRYLRALAIDEPRQYNHAAGVQLEVVLTGASGVRHTRRVEVGALCLRHAGPEQPHIAGDTIVMHRDSVIVELPEHADLDHIEVAYYEHERGQLVRRSIGTTKLVRDTFDPAGGPLGYADLAFANPFDDAPPSVPLGADVFWPEDFADPDVYAVFGDGAESEQRINVVIVPDGYRYADKSLMQTHAIEMVEHFRQKTPYAEHDPFLNYILVFAYSVDAGTDECDCGIIVNTAMGTRFPLQNPSCGHSDNRCLYYGGGCDTSGSSNIVASELRAPYHDATIVMVNTGRYGGCGGSRAVYSAANASAKEIAVHELGHSLGGLADEYSYDPSCGSFAGEVNTSADATIGAWPEWISDLGTPVEGAQYYQQCLYRPTPNCEMRNLGVPFCAVCNQHWSLITFGHARVAPTAPIESQSPGPAVSAWVRIPREFSLATRLSEGAGVTNQITWTMVGPGSTPSYVVAIGTTALTHAFEEEGEYTLEAQVIADANFVKPTKNGANVDVANWQIQVTALAPPPEVSAPGSAAPLRFTGRDTLVWEDASSHGAFSYNVYRGALGAIVSGTYGDCLESAVDENTTIDPDEPPTAVGWMYLVAGANPTGEGPLGTTSDGSPRASGTSCD